MDERDKCSDLKIEMDRFESVMNLPNPKTQYRKNKKGLHYFDKIN